MQTEDVIIDGTNVLAEVALALSMAFFCLLVLALVSFSPEVQPPQKTVSYLMTPSDEGGTRDVSPEDLIIFWQGSYFDGEGKPLNRESLSSVPAKFLALSQELSGADMMSALKPFPAQDLGITFLTDDWQDYFKQGVNP